MVLKTTPISLSLFALFLAGCATSTNSSATTSSNSNTETPTTEAPTTEAPTTETPTTEVTTAPATTDNATTDTETTEGTPVGQAEFVLAGEDYADEAFSWSNDGGNLVFCHYYAGEAKGDYLWIRFAESPESNGDDSPHIDMDVCRFGKDGFGGTFNAQDPTNFGTKCPDDPGFGIWWHAGEVAYNNDPAAQDCELTASVDGEVVSGTFTCTPLPEVDGTKTLAVSKGSFSCKAEPK